MKGARVIFVAGTDTGVGKSVITGLLARYLLDKGRRVGTQKWVQTGCPSGIGDIGAHLRFMGKSRKEFAAHIHEMLPYRFRFASSPHLASRREGMRIDIDRIIKSLKSLSRSFDYVIVEGTGGLMTPLDDKTLMIDLIERLALPVILVAANRLGAINHAVLSAEAIRARGIKSIGVIFNDISKVPMVISKDNPAAVKTLARLTVLGRLPRSNDARRLRRLFAPIGDRIF